MECDGPCGYRLIVVMSQDSVGASEFEMRDIKESPDQPLGKFPPPLPRVILVVGCRSRHSL